MPRVLLCKTSSPRLMYRWCAGAPGLPHCPTTVQRHATLPPDLRMATDSSGRGPGGARSKVCRSAVVAQGGTRGPRPTPSHLHMLRTQKPSLGQAPSTETSEAVPLCTLETTPAPTTLVLLLAPPTPPLVPAIFSFLPCASCVYAFGVVRSVFSFTPATASRHRQ
jgi:hypothetical protein